jgi:hypothetical protein
MVNKNSFNLFILILLLPFACRKPFDGVNAIVSNSYISYRVSGQIIDANSITSNPYPANSTVTVSGDAVDQGLIYNESGQQIITGTNNINVVSNSFSIVVKPYYVISTSNPLKLSLFVSAPGYISNFKDLTITNLDSLQYLTIKLLNNTNLPSGVSNVVASLPVNPNGSVKNDTSITVSNNPSNNTSATQLANATQLTVKANTTFKDASGTPIASSLPVSFSVTAFSGMSKDALAAITGGVTNVNTTSSSITSFTVGGAIDINATLGGTAIKTLSQPITAKILLDPTTLNPNTGLSVKVGDSIETWSNDTKTNLWNYEDKSIIFIDPLTRQLATNISITHFSTWASAFSSNLCANPFQINYTTSDLSTTTVFYEILSQTGNKQLISSRKVSAKNGDKILFSLSQGIPFVVNMYVGSDENGLLISSTNFNPCSIGVTYNYIASSTKPILYFDLQTYCTNGVFRYTGPIDYKISGTNIWQTFTPSNNGTLTSTLLDWNVTYDFRIIYKGAEYRRSKQVIQSEFRQTIGTNNSWYYWGKDPANKQTFFSSPTACN